MHPCAGVVRACVDFLLGPQAHEPGVHVSVETGMVPKRPGEANQVGVGSVSYTHLDVYKRQDLGHDMSSLRRLFGVFEQKTELMRLLDVSSRAEGVRIYIGGESQVVPFEELSVVTAPYEVDGRIVGTLGVIGPTRMAYDRMIQIVDITARLVGNALSGKS